jgi:hypothetical protein
LGESAAISGKENMSKQTPTNNPMNTLCITLPSFIIFSKWLEATVSRHKEAVVIKIKLIRGWCGPQDEV